MVAVIRPDAWNLPLFLHVAGAMLLVGALVVVAATMAGALRGGDGAGALTGLAFRTLLIGVLPAYVLMRVGAEWIASEEGVPDDVDWIGIGYAVADGGLLLTIIATVLAWRAKRRGAAGPGGLGRGVLGLAAVLLVAYGVAIWAMTAKPGF
jgi:hypothetical protein